MLKLATLIENPGEPTVETRYHDPEELKSLGYNGLVVYETTALSGIASPDVVQNAELRRWVQNHFEKVTRTVERAHAAGLAVYVFYDAPVLARDVVERNLGGYTCRNRADVLCPASELTLEASVRGCEAMLSRFPQVQGIVLRFGDTDAGRMPHLVGNDAYTPHCPRCSQFGRADRIVTLLERFHSLVVGRFNKRLIARAWNVRPNGFHDSVELAQRICSRLPGADNEKDDRFVLSFKFTQTDFWRYQKWNLASLQCGKRPILYELQCQREFEGKGGLPNWQVPLWRNGYPESQGSTDVAGLAAAHSKINFAGLWAWVRGGGWGGPYVKNETWIDANVFAVPRLADDPAADPRELGRQWIAQRLKVEEPALTAKLLETLEASPEIVRKLFYIGPFARGKADQWHPSGDWISDDLLDAHSAWRIIQRLPDAQLDAVVAEKQEAVEAIAALRAGLQQAAGGGGERSHPALDPLVNTLVYGESFAEALRDLLAGLVAYRRFQRTKERPAADATKQKLFAAQSHWNHHTQRHGSLPGAATAFRETHFWDLTQQILSEVT